MRKDLHDIHLASDIMSADKGTWSYSAVMMGSPILLKLLEPDESLARRVFSLIKQQEDILTVNRPCSEMMSVNHAAGSHPVKVSQPVYQLIICALNISLLPDSPFNVTIGPIVKRWKIGFQGNSVPPHDELKALLRLTDPSRVITDDRQHTVFLPEKGMELDAGAIAKGYIADLVQKYLSQQGVRNALINLGGNVHTLGKPPGTDGWSVGLKKPFTTTDELIGLLQVKEKSVVTSGIYERYFELNGRCYHHILDPKTGYPLDNELLSVTIISSRSLDGDIWSSLLYGMGPVAGCAYLQQLPHIEAIFITRDQRVILSSQRQFCFTLLDNDYYLDSSRLAV